MNELDELLLNAAGAEGRSRHAWEAMCRAQEIAQAAREEERRAKKKLAEYLEAKIASATPGHGDKGFSPVPILEAREL